MKSDMSHSHLRGVITQRLSTAATEILADVEMTFVVYEAEVSGLKQEIDRLKSQLELLQPRVKEEPADDQVLFSPCGASGSERPREDVGQTCEIKLENPQILKILSFTGGHKEEYHIDKQDPEVASRLFPSAVLTDGRNMDTSHIRNLESYVDLKICILNDWSIEVVSDQVDEYHPIHELQFHSGQQEDDFLMLLRSTFPQLAPNTPFETFITDATNRLQPLKVESFTPEQICSAAGNSPLYIRLKHPTEHEAGSQQQPVQVSDDDFDEGSCYEDASSIQLQTLSNSNLSNESPQKKPVEDQSSENEDIFLKVRVLEDSRIVALSKTVLKKYKPKKLRCPRGMQEAEFLKMLKSTFPQLDDGRPFEYLITNITKKLLPLKVESFTPEKISSAARSSGIYIRLKPVEGDIKSRLKDLLLNKAGGQKKKKESQNKYQIKETDTHINLRIHVLEESDIEVVTSEVLRKYRLNKLECPRGMKEEDFLNLLRSTFPKLTFFEIFKCDRNGKLLPLNVKSFTPELICMAAGTSALYIRLKHPEILNNKKEEPRQKNQDAAHPSSPLPSALSTKNESPNRNPAGDKDSHLNLNVCYLDGSQDAVFSSHDGASSTFSSNPQLFFKKFPIHELRCPRGLQETDFVAFLGSTFSQLAVDQPLSVFALQGQKMLKLKLNSVIPEEIRKTIDSMGSSVICIQQLDPPQKDVAEPKDFPTMTHPSTPYTSIQSPSGTPDGPPNCDPENLVELKLCIVDDPKINVTSPLVLQKYPILEFQCPGTLKEAEFLNLLRTTFPQLAGEALDFLTGHGANVKPINLENLTSHEISRTLKLTGSSLLYIRLKEQREIQASVKRSQSDVSFPGKHGKKRRKRGKVQSSKSLSSEDDETEDSEDDDEQESVKSTKLLGLESLLSKYSASNKPVKTQDEHPDATANIQTDDESTDDSEDENYYKNPQFSKLSLMPSHMSGHSSKQDAKTEHPGMIEQKRSDEKTNIQVEDDETEDSEDYDDNESVETFRLLSFHPRRSGNNTKQNTSRKRVKTLKKKEVKQAVGMTNLRIEEVEIVDSEDGDDDKNAESIGVTSLQPQICGKDAKQKTRKEAVKMVKIEEIIDIEDDNGDVASSPPQVSSQDAKQKKTSTGDGKVLEKKKVKHTVVRTKGKMEAVEIVDSDNGDDDKDSKSSSLLSPQPQLSSQDLQQHNTTEAKEVWEKKAISHSDPNTNSKLSTSQTADNPLQICKVCKNAHLSRRLLIRHVWKHVNDQGSLCGVCGKEFDLKDSLRNHLQTHEKTYTCKICGKTFISRHGFKGHMNRHKVDEAKAE
ncbi:uncharacterized protein FYW61_019125 [Anableps anableps]